MVSVSGRSAEATESCVVRLIFPQIISEKVSLVMQGGPPFTFWYGHCALADRPVHVMAAADAFSAPLSRGAVCAMISLKGRKRHAGSGRNGGRGPPPIQFRTKKCQNRCGC